MQPFIKLIINTFFYSEIISFFQKCTRKEKITTSTCFIEKPTNKFQYTHPKKKKDKKKQTNFSLILNQLKIQFLE